VTPRWIVELALAITVAVWAGNYIIVKAALATWNPMAFNACRCILAAALMYAVIRVTSAGAWRPRRQLASLTLLGGWNAAYQILFVLALERTTASNAALILATMPVWVGLWGQVSRSERLSPKQWLGIASSLVGVALVAGGSRGRVRFGRPAGA